MGIDKEFLLSNPDIFDIHVSEFSERVHKYGGIIIQAHPFRYLKGHELRIFVPYVDAIEIYNGSHVLTLSHYPPFYNDLAEAFAKEMHIIGTAGSDNHDVRKDTNTPLRIASMLFDEKIHDINQMAELIKNNRFSICKE